jgi:hypothetical protein
MGPAKIGPPFDRLSEPAQKAYLWAKYHPQLQAHGEDYFAEELAEMFDRQRRDPQPLGNRPLIALTGRNEANTPPDGIDAQRCAEVMTEKKPQKQEMAKLSSNSRFIQDSQSGHHIHLDNPPLVISAIRDVVESARLGKPLSFTAKPKAASAHY